MITYVYTDYEDCEYITAGKLYEVYDGCDLGGKIRGDDGFETYVHFGTSHHINNKPWSIHKSNYRVGDKVEDVCSGYGKETVGYGKVDFGEVTEVTLTGIEVLWEGCIHSYFCREDQVKPYVMPVVEPEDDVEEPFVGHSSEPFGWTSFTGLSDGKDPYLCCGTTDEWCGEDKIKVTLDIPDDSPTKTKDFIDKLHNSTYKFEGWDTQSGPKKSDGGPSSYYDFPQGEEAWVTLNDMNDYKAVHQWGPLSFHMTNVNKATFRFGEKDGTSKIYDVNKIIYSGLRMKLMLEDKESVRTYLQQLLDDPQFQTTQKET